LIRPKTYQQFNFCLIFLDHIKIKKITIFAALKNADVA